MKTFVRNLYVSNEDKLENVLSSCNKILIWLNPHTQYILNYDDVETLLKASIYMEECMALFGAVHLLQALITYEPGLEEFYKAQRNVIKENAFISHTISLILSTTKSMQYLRDIEAILHNIYKKEEIEQFLQTAVIQAKSSFVQNVQQKRRSNLHLAILYLFRLPQTDWEMGMERLIEHLHFQVLGYAFLEGESSAYFPHCSILIEYICDRLSDCTIPTYFIDSLQQTASFSYKGRCFYWECLKNMCFARHFRNFCIKYLEKIDETAHLQQYNMQNICYLLGTAVSRQSPCRLAYQRALNGANIIPHYMSHIQRQIITFSA